MFYVEFVFWEVCLLDVCMFGISGFAACAGDKLCAGRGGAGNADGFQDVEGGVMHAFLVVRVQRQGMAAGHALRCRAGDGRDCAGPARLTGGMATRPSFFCCRLAHRIPISRFRYGSRPPVMPEAASASRPRAEGFRGLAVRAPYSMKPVNSETNSSPPTLPCAVEQGNSIRELAHSWLSLKFT